MNIENPRHSMQYRVEHLHYFHVLDAVVNGTHLQYSFTSEEEFVDERAFRYHCEAAIASFGQIVREPRYMGLRVDQVIVDEFA